MKRKEIKNLHIKSIVELKKELWQKQTEITKIMLERSVKKQKNTRITRALRDDIAKIQTVLAEVISKGAKKV